MIYTIATLFALFGYAFGFAHGNRRGHAIGYKDGRKHGTYWERWRQLHRK